MDVRDRRRVPIAGVIVGGFLLGAGVFGLFRVADAQPLPPPSDLPALPPPGGGSALPPPAMPTLPALPPIETAAGSVPPPALPKLPPEARSSELKPLPGIPEPSPLPSPGPLPPPAAPPTPAKPLDTVPLPSPSLDPLPSPALPPPVAKPELPPVPPTIPPTTDPLPKPVEPPAAFGPLPKLPADTKPVAPPPPPLTDPLPPAKPESNLRPELPAPNVTPDGSAGRDVLPPPVAVAPPSPSPAPGVAPMTLSPHKTLLTAAAGVALAFTPIVSQAQDPKPPATDTKPTLETLDAKVKELTADIKKVREEKDKLELLVNGTFTQPGLVKRLEQAQADLKAMDEKMKSLEEKLATKTTSEKTTLPSAMIGKGKVVLVNEFRTKLSVMVNGTSYPLDPSQTKDVLVGTGEFTYELVEFPNAAPVKSNIKEGETVTLRIK